MIEDRSSYRCDRISVIYHGAIEGATPGVVDVTAEVVLNLVPVDNRRAGASLISAH